MIDSKGDPLAVLSTCNTEIVVVNIAKMSPIISKKGGGRILVKNSYNKGTGIRATTPNRTTAEISVPSKDRLLVELKKERRGEESLCNA
jgi:hypothetical protein